MSIYEQLPVSRTLSSAEEKRMSHTDLVMNSMREALLYTRECSHGKIRDDALVSLCYDTMMKSARIFKPGRLRFFAYCKARLRGELKRYWENLGTVRNATTVSLDAPIQHTKTKPVLHEEEEHPVPTAERVGGMVEPDFDRIYMEDSWKAVSAAAAKHCSDLERTVLFLAYKSQLSFEEIGDLLDLSRQFVSVTSQKAIKKIRRALKRF